MSILDSELATAITDALVGADIPQDVVVTRQELDPESPPWEPTYSQVSHSCSGWRDTFSAQERANGDVLVTDAKVFVVASSLDIEPSTSDTVTIGGSAYSIITIELDPASATWVLQCRV